MRPTLSLAGLALLVLMSYATYENTKALNNVIQELSGHEADIRNLQHNRNVPAQSHIEADTPTPMTKAPGMMYGPDIYIGGKPKQNKPIPHLPNPDLHSI